MTMTTRTDLPFYKMHGLGNDFIVLDSRAGQLMPDADQMRLLADRRLGLGCDQIMVIAALTPRRQSGLICLMQMAARPGRAAMARAVLPGW